MIRVISLCQHILYIIKIELLLLLLHDARSSENVGQNQFGCRLLPGVIAQSGELGSSPIFVCCQLVG